MNHNPSNPNCDKNQYAGADGVRCTCDVDDADGPAPSTVVRHEAVMAAYPPAMGGPSMPPVTLTGRKAETHVELVHATREMRAAQQLLKPAEERWRRAMDAHMEALLQP